MELKDAFFYLSDVKVIQPLFSSAAWSRSKLSWESSTEVLQITRLCPMCIILKSEPSLFKESTALLKSFLLYINGVEFVQSNFLRLFASDGFEEMQAFRFFQETTIFLS